MGCAACRTAVAAAAAAVGIWAVAIAADPSQKDRTPQVDADQLRQAKMMEDLMFGKGPIGGPFSLPDTGGSRRSLSEFRGKLVVLYFGYTSCPDVCPTDLAQIGAAIRDLRGDEARVQPIFITLDPERDTAALLGEYLANFHPRFIGLRGTTAEIRSVADRYKVYFKKVRGKEPGSYFVDHSPYVFLIGTKGEFLGSLPPGTTATRLEQAIRTSLSVVTQ
ncbi:MAG TPA: SCO family protein [Burkholderiales bacterium]|nr:SCO family protein [Burkholderiales bacterium]